MEGTTITLEVDAVAAQAYAAASIEERQKLQLLLNLRLRELTTQQSLPLRGGEMSPAQACGEDFLTRAHRLDQLGRTDAALDLIYDQIDEMLLAKQFESVDQVLKQTDTNIYSIDVLLALLTITLAAKNQLPGRASFYHRVEKTLTERGELRSGLLIGLE